MLRPLFLALLLSACASTQTTSPPASEPITPTTGTSGPATSVPATSVPDRSSTTLPAAPATTSTTLSGVTVLEVTVADGAVAQLRATLDDEVRLTVYSDEADEVHLHTYDIHADVAPGAPAVLEFVASIPGIFEIEFEEAGTLIAELRVDP